MTRKSKHGTAVRAFLAAHPGASQSECARGLGLKIGQVHYAFTELRASWGAGDKHRQPGVSNGHRIRGKPDGLLAISARFDEDTFAQVRTLAEKAGVSLSEQIRQLVEIGLEDTAP